MAARVVKVTSSLPNGTYGYGSTVRINVEFSEAVGVVPSSNGDFPELELEGIGSATYVGGSGTPTLTFEYRVGVNDAVADLNYRAPLSVGGTQISALTIANGGTFTNIDSRDQVTPFAGLEAIRLPDPALGDSLGRLKDIRLDGKTLATAAVVTGVTSPVADSKTSDGKETDYGVGSVLPIEVYFSKPVAVVSDANPATDDIPELVLDTNDNGQLDADDARARYVGGSGTNALTFLYEVAAGQNSKDLNYAGTNALELKGAKIVDLYTSSSNNAISPVLPVLTADGSLARQKDLIIGGGSFTGELAPDSAADFDPDADEQTLRGKNGNDKSLKGSNELSDNLFGRGGEDRVLGRGKNDFLDGGEGDDRLDGGKGNDVLVGGEGDDLLLGRQGKDVFRFDSVEDGVDTIRGFKLTEDVIDLREIFQSLPNPTADPLTRLNRFVSLDQEVQGAVLRVDDDGDANTPAKTLATLVGVQANTLTAAQFVL